MHLGSLDFPRDAQVSVTLDVTVQLSTVGRGNTAGVGRVCLRAECVFLLEHYLVSKSFYAIPETYSNAFPDKEVHNKTTTILVPFASLCVPL
jgi:hypothetical protein